MNIYQEPPSSTKRPQVNDRSTSSHSISRASPTTGKGSTAKLHKAYAVGHGRHPHGRIPSSKNLSKLGKGAATNAHDDHSKTNRQSKAKLQSPSTSPSAADLKRNSSHISLPRSGSKVSIKKNASNLSQKRNKSSTKLGNLNKGDRTGVEHESLGKLGSNGAQFSIGSDDQDDGWVEAGDSSQSPSVMKHPSTTNGKTQSSSLDEPPSLSSGNVRASSSESPPTAAPLKAQRNHDQSSNGSSDDPYPNHDNAEIVTNGLLHRNGVSNIGPQTSNISATITPSASNGSPVFKYSHDATLRNEPSMPPDGISRFLNSTGTSAETESVTPNSLSLQIHSKLAGINREHRRNGDGSSAQNSPPTPPEASATTAPSTFSRHARRARSAVDLGTNKGSSDAQTPSPKSTSHRHHPFPSAAQNHQSLTQLKLDLQRLSTHRPAAHAPAIQPPLSGAPHASFANLTLINTHGDERGVEERKVKMWEQAEVEYFNGRRFVGVVGRGIGRAEAYGKDKNKGVEASVGQGKDAPGKGRDKKDERLLLVSTSADSAHTRPESRGRVRFEVGGMQGQGHDSADRDEEGGGLEGLLSRMWEGDGGEGGED
ncbi:MAG: hypothetical protein Q9202_001170 [Teloschistes flavicans]